MSIDDGTVGDDFRLGYRFQTHWDVAMASAFFCGEVGAGLFLVSLACGSALGMGLGLAITGLGKAFFHLTHMGVPRRAWRAILRPDRSWTSRGLIGIIVLCGAGGLYAIDRAAGGFIAPVPRDALGVLAAVAALLVMTYQGLAMAQSSAIALWNTAAIPLIGLVYGLASGFVLVQALHLDEGVSLSRIAAALLAAVAMTLFSLLYTVYRGSPAGRLSVTLLTRSRFALPFHAIVVFAGIVLPLAALLFAHGTPARVLAAIGTLAGFYAFRVLVFKAGVYQPVMRFGARRAQGACAGSRAGSRAEGDA